MTSPGQPQPPIWLILGDLFGHCGRTWTTSNCFQIISVSIFIYLSWTTSRTILDNMEQILLLNFVLNNTISHLESSLLSAPRYLVSVPTTRYLLLPQGLNNFNPKSGQLPQFHVELRFPFPEPPKTEASILGEVWELRVLLTTSSCWVVLFNLISVQYG